MNASYFVHLCLIKMENSNLKVVLSWFGCKYIDGCMYLSAFDLLKESAHMEHFIDNRI